MADLSGPDFITLLVSDLDASHHFYSEFVGLKKSPEKRQSFSDDGGKTWEVNWIATDTRTKD
jgi:catechol 2,3-dioxygenase-like lactoylglutathione lyase family enzyme